MRMGAVTLPERARRSTGFTVLALACSLAATGCGGDGASDAGSPAPAATRSTAASAGFTRTDAGKIVFEHPSAWQRGPTPKGWAVAVVEQPGQYPVARAGVLTKVPKISDPEALVTSVFVQLRANLSNLRRGPIRQVSVPGARGAARLDYTYAEQSGDSASSTPSADAPQDGLNARGTDVGVVLADRQSVVVRIAGLRSKLPDATVERIVRSIAVRTGG